MSLARRINVPVEKFIVTKGWYFRLKKRKINKVKFRKLTKNEKRKIKQYWKRYGKNISTDWASYFSYSNEIVDEKYIPESLYYGEICRGLNDYAMRALHHKNVQDQIFNSLQPKTIVRKNGKVILDKNYRPITTEEAVVLCKEQRNVIAKPSTGAYGGSGIEFWDNNKKDEVIRDIITNSENLIIQEVVKQHPFFEAIHPKSLNTLRVVTLLIKGKPILLSTLLRMGQNGMEVDNYTAGGIVCPVSNEGELFDSGIQSDQSIINKHPDGFVFKGKKIPNFRDVIEESFKQHYRVPYFKFISWDFSLSPEGVPILIEANIPKGQLDFHQLNIGPLFGEYTDRVLDHVYRGKEL